MNLNPPPLIDASLTQRGAVSVGTQSFAGAKSFAAVLRADSDFYVGDIAHTGSGLKFNYTGTVGQFAVNGGSYNWRLNGTTNQLEVDYPILAPAVIASNGALPLKLYNNTTGGAPGDILTVVGAGIADASVNAGAKLLSIQTGIAGTPVEKAYFLKTGQLNINQPGINIPAIQLPSGVGGFGYGGAIQWATFNAIHYTGTSMYMQGYGAGVTSNVLSFQSQARLIGFSGAGAMSGTDIATKIGTKTVDASITAGAKLASFRTGIDTTEVEKGYIDAAGNMVLSGTVTVAGVVSGTGAVVTQTTTNLTYYVDAAGSDSNDGLTVGTPLLRISTALAKLPTVINHGCTINVAAGSYDEHVVTPRFLMNANVIVQGAAMTNYTPGAGVSSGTFDATFTDWAPHVASVAGGGWTPNTLQGYFIRIMSGPGVGLYLAIATNTATTLCFGTPVNTGTYNLQGATFQIVQLTTMLTNSGIGSVINIENSVGATIDNVATNTAPAAAAVVFNNVSLSRASSGAILTISGASTVYLNNVRFVGGTTISTTTTLVDGCRLQFNDCSFIAAALAFSLQCNALLNRIVINGLGARGGITVGSASQVNLTLSGGFIYDLGASRPAISSGTVANNGNLLALTDLAIDGVSAGIATLGIQFTGIDMPASGLCIRNCGVGVRLGCSINYALGSSVPLGRTAAKLTAFTGSNTINACGTGVIVAGSTDLTLYNMTISNCTSYGVNVAPTVHASHSAIRLLGTNVFTGNAVDFTLNGTDTLSLTALRALTPKVVVDLTNFNRISEG